MANGEWSSVEDIIDKLQDEHVRIWTDRKMLDQIIWVSDRNVLTEICRIHLDGDEHVYMVDGFWCHNVLVKNGG
jgi:hypothetical protein